MKKRKLKFNFIDILIVFVLAVAFVVCFKFIGAKAPEGISILDVIGVGEKNYVYYTVEIQRVPTDYKYNYTDGDAVYNMDTGILLGNVVSVEAKPATNTVADVINGGFKLSEYEDREDVYITLKFVPKVSEHGITIGGKNIKVGTAIKIQKPGCVGEGYIVDLKTDAEGGAYK